MDDSIEHERERLHRLVDEFIDAGNSNFGDTDDDDETVFANPRINTAAIVVIYNWDDEDGDTHEIPAIYAETRNVYSQVGLLDVTLTSLRSKFHEF